MKLGISLAQGCDREYLGLDARTAWDRTIASAREAEALGFESIWINDHFQVDPPLIEAPIFEPFVELTGLAMATQRVRLGHLVLAAAYRNAALTAKMISTLDVVSGGRVELGIGAGWKEDEWLAYGYGFPGRARAIGHPGRSSRDHHPDAGPRASDVRGSATPAFTTRSMNPRASRSRGSRSSSAATAPG